MRINLLRIIVASAFAALPLASFAQSSAPEKAPAGSMEQRYGESPHCAAKTGTEKEQCLRDEAQKTEGSKPDDKAPQGNAGTGSSSAPTPATSAETPKASSTPKAAPSTKQ